jgi:hypothetical protein
LEYYQWDGPDPFIPVEFSVAAYRFGHSQLRPGYRINDNYEIGMLPLFSAKPGGEERQDLQGGPIKMKHVVNWKNFFKTGVSETSGWERNSKKINTMLASPLLYPPPTVVPNRPGESRSLATTGLAVRDLERGRAMDLPSGQKVAKMMRDKKRIKVYDIDKSKLDFDKLKELWRDSPEGQRQFEKIKGQIEQDTPLWYYILKEAEVQHGGKMLGDVGGHIVAEVIIGLLQADEKSLMAKVDLAHLYTILRDDPNLRDDPDVLDQSNQRLQISPESFQNEDRTWKPILPIKRNSKFTKNDVGDFTIVDLLRFAGVDTE